ncbi:MAG: amino acid adenylation domain-containing protein, partial [Pseudomonadales bacterium]|nr:amino acid adenylation domain-containing protein [Pseudomonadales bacterium]
VPMDPKYPDDRIRYMIDNSCAKVLITQQSLLDKVATDSSTITLCLDRDAPLLSNQSTVNPNLQQTPRDRAYMIYTSGSTGLPKGAIVRHDGALNHIEAEREVLAFSGSFSFLQTAPASSDISVWQFLGPVTCGGTVVVLDDVTHSKKLFQLVKHHGIDVVELVPVALQLLMEYVRTLPLDERALPDLRWMMATGEAVSVDLVNEWLALYPDIPVVNAYGPTEAADDVIQCAISKPLPANQRSVPIGKPLPNLSVYILDDQRRLLPAGVAGEICIGGIGVGEGYWNNPEKTASAFVANPFKSGEVIYRTGDLGRWLADGSVEYLDRVDNQVKVRGFRIELGEVESALSSLPGVRENVVIVRDDLPGGTALAAYVVATEQVSSLDATTLRAQMRESVPDFMVPAFITVMDQLPLTPAGKIDRKALPRPESIQLGGGEYIEPRNNIERDIASIWESLMPLERISVRDNFFEIGGHSLIGVRIIARINKAFNTQLQVAALLKAQTIENLAKMVEQGETSDSVLVPITQNENPPVFMVHPVGGDVLCYADLAQALSSEFSVYGLRAQGLDGATQPFESIDQMASAYVEAILEQQPQGPYRLVGQSLGGIIAMAVASKLIAQGHRVSHVVMLDTFSPAHLASNSASDSAILASAMGGPLPEVQSQEETGEKSEAYIAQLYSVAQQSGAVPKELTQ